MTSTKDISTIYIINFVVSMHRCRWSHKTLTISICLDLNLPKVKCNLS